MRRNEKREGKGHAPRADEHVHGVRGALERGRNEHEGRAEEDGGAPAEAVGHVRREGVRAERADVLARAASGGVS